MDRSTIDTEPGPYTRDSAHGPFVAGGILLVVGLVGALKGSAALAQTTLGVPTWFAAWYGVGVAAFGTWLLASGAFRLLRLGQATEEGVHHGPWETDFEWSGRRMGDARVSDASPWLVLALISVVAVLPPAIASVLGDGGWGLGRVVALLLALASFGGLLWAGGRMLQAVGERIFVKLPRFPLSNRGPIELSLEIPNDAEEISGIVATLRFVEETVDMRSGQTTRWQQWAHTLELPAPDALEVPLRFDIPKGVDLTTMLSAAPPRYWELLIEFRMAEASIRGSIPLPIYRTEAAADDGPGAPPFARVGDPRGPDLGA